MRRRSPSRASRLLGMSKAMIERRLIEVGERLKQLRGDLQVADEQRAHFANEADDARLRSLVSETQIAGREHRDADRHAAAMRRHRDEVATETTSLEAQQDELLDQLMAS